MAFGEGQSRSLKESWNCDSELTESSRIATLILRREIFIPLKLLLNKRFYWFNNVDMSGMGLAFF